MANDITRNRQGDSAEDPLAELARLMGQEDEFAELLRKSKGGSSGASSTQSRPAAGPARAPASRPVAPNPPPRPAAPRPPTPPRAGESFGDFGADFGPVPRGDASARQSAQPRSERGRLEDTARDLNRSFRPEAPAARAPDPRSYDLQPVDQRAPGRRPAQPRPGEAPSSAAPQRPAARNEQAAFIPPRPRSTDPSTRAASAAPAQRASVSDGAADAVSRALAEPFDLGPEPARPAARPEARPDPRAAERPLPSWMARGAGPAATAAPEAAPEPARRQAATDRVSHDDAYDYGRSAAVEHEYDAQEGVDETYEIEADDEPRRSGRSRLALVGVLMVGAIAATAGVYAYMSGPNSTASTDGEPPMIRADQGPNKVVPDQPAQDQASDGQKLIYDRVGGSPTTGNEQVVSSEEQPVDVSQAAQPQQPRVIQTSPTNGAPAAPAPANATEPKRVRTLTVRADGTIVEDASPSPLPGEQSSVDSTQSTASTPIALSSGAGGPVSIDPTPMSNTPSIVPNVPAPAQVAAVPAPAPAPAASAAPATPGNYVVQIASVRSEAEAQTTWRTMQSRFPNVLGNQQVAIRRADLGDRGIYYRAQVGNFASRDDAVSLCESLRAAGGDCMVQRN